MKTFHELAINETLDTLQENGTNLTDNPFRLGSMMYFEVIKEARKRLNEGRYTLTEVDKQILETDLGEFDVCEGNLVPLDCPMIVEEEEKQPEKIEKNNAFINYGFFTTKTTLNKLELVESAKKK